MIGSFIRKVRWVVGGMAAAFIGISPLFATPVLEPVQGFVQPPSNSYGKLTVGPDGNFYGTTRWGGRYSNGTIFRMTPGGSVTTLVSFDSGDTTTGWSPVAGLCLGSDGNFYGTAENGGAIGHGTFFRMTPQGVFTNLVNFGASESPQAKVVEGADGNFYGTGGGGANHLGQIFKITPAGELTTVFSFTSTTGHSPNELVKANDGFLYGTTNGDGSGGGGTFFRYDISGAYTQISDFAATPTRFSSPLIQAVDGNFYGVADGSDVIFKITPEGVMTNLATLNFTSTGGWPRGGLTQAPDGNFYGVTAIRSGGEGAVFKVTATGVLSTVAIFHDTDGSKPMAPLTVGPDGSLYGSTSEGGSADFGTLFKINAGGALTTLSHFTTPFGLKPSKPLVLGDDGNFYGVTTEGGPNRRGCLFRMTPGGDLTYLADMARNSSDYYSLSRGSDGNLYGILEDPSWGTVFKATLAGEMTTLADMSYATGGADGTLVEGADGNFYGTSDFGGEHEDGTIYKVTPQGGLTRLFSFDELITGSNPFTGLTRGANGDFYGTTAEGGESRRGTLYKVTQAGAFTVLAHFATDTVPFDNFGPMKLGSDGNFYATAVLRIGGIPVLVRITPAGNIGIVAEIYAATGTNFSGPPSEGADGSFYLPVLDGGGMYGSILRIKSDGVVSIVGVFTGANGSSPSSGLTKGRDGHLYGVTYMNGVTSDGQATEGGGIYRLRLGPEATTNPISIRDTTDAVLRGGVNPGGDLTRVSFEYGTSPELESFATIEVTTLAAGSGLSSIEKQLSGLSPGTIYYYRIVASNAENDVPQKGRIISFTTLNTPFGQWLSDRAAGAAGGDPDHDGVVNLLEYAFGSDPVDPLAPTGMIRSGPPMVRGVPTFAGDSPSGSARQILFVRRKDRATSGLVYTPQFSTDLATWVGSTATPTVIAVDDEVEVVAVPCPDGFEETGKVFFRLSVTVP